MYLVGLSSYTPRSCACAQEVGFVPPGVALVRNGRRRPLLFPRSSSRLDPEAIRRVGGSPDGQAQVGPHPVRILFSGRLQRARARATDLATVPRGRLPTQTHAPVKVRRSRRGALDTESTGHHAGRDAAQPPCSCLEAEYGVRLLAYGRKSDLGILEHRRGLAFVSTRGIHKPYLYE
jgi:hypothetical protein